MPWEAAFFLKSVQVCQKRRQQLTRTWDEALSSSTLCSIRKQLATAPQERYCMLAVRFAVVGCEISEERKVGLLYHARRTDRYSSMQLTNAFAPLSHLFMSFCVRRSGENELVTSIHQLPVRLCPLCHGRA